MVAGSLSPTTANPVPSGDKAANPNEANKVAAARKAARGFEAFFLTQMLSHMFESVPVDSLFGGGQSERVYRSMLLDQYGRAIANHGGIGIADMVMREMLKAQEAQATP